jgi:Integrase zinc binding domain/Chromo (CHRromatin Organisation MOdifier) domain
MNIWHEGSINGHPGRDETIRRINREYFWPGAKTWITEYIKGCATCQQNKNLTHRIKTPLFRIPSSINAKPFSHIAMDLITGLPESNGHDTILTIVDHGCSRAAIFLPCSTTITGASIAQLYLEHLFRWFGIPQKIISDRDPRFTSHFARELTKGLGIDQNLSTAFHPQMDGLSERVNQWVEQYLRLITANQNEWSKWLPMATVVHNNSKNSTTGFAPNELLIGWEPPLASEQHSESKNQTAEEYLSKMRQNRLMAIHTLNKVAHRIHISPNRWTTGQLVWLEGKNLPLAHGTAKLAPRRHGPFKIIQIVSPVAVRLELPPQWNIHPVFHNSLLTPYTETPSHGPNFTRPPLDLIDGEEEYEVEQIRSHRTWGRSRTLQYLIKWKGYPESNNTWEGADQIHVPELIKLYHKAVTRHGLKAQRIRLEKKHPLTISPPKTFTSPHSYSTILRDSTAALVWSTVHERNNRSACNPPTPLAPSPYHPKTHVTQTSCSATSTGHPSILQTSTGSNANSQSIQHLLAPKSSTQCPPSVHTTPQTNPPTRHPSNYLLASTPRPRCHSHPTPSIPPSRTTPTSTIPCCEPSPMASSKPSLTEKPVRAWPPSAMRIASIISSSGFSTTKQPSITHLRGMRSTMGRLPTSKSPSAMDCIKRPGGSNSTTTVQSRVTLPLMAPTSNPSLSIYMPHRTIVSTPLLTRYRLGSDTCSRDQGATSTFCRGRWPTQRIGDSPGRSLGIVSSTTTSRRWPSKSRSISVIWMPRTLASAAAKPASRSRVLPSDLPPSRTCRGRSGPYARDGRRPPACCEEFKSVPRHWRMSRMSADVHHRAEGDVTGLGAACRAGTHVSCATGQESVICLCRGLVCLCLI